MNRTYRLVRAKAARSKLRVARAWFWHLGVKQQDIFQASYPRSGSTWLRFILFQILRGEESGFGKIDQCIPEIYTHRGIRPILPGGGRLIKTHEKYRADYTKAVFLVRDLRDVVLSCYATGLAPIVSKGDFDSFLLSFLQGRALQMGSWQEHTRSWLESPLVKNGNLMIVRYEDLRPNPEETILRLLRFLEVTPDLQSVRKAIEDNSLVKMRAKEDRARNIGERSDLLPARKAPGEEGRFVRKGAVGGWRDKLSNTQQKLINQYAGDMLAALGYEAGETGEPRTETMISAFGV